MLIDLVRRRSVRILVQLGAATTAAVAVIGALALPDPLGQTVAVVALVSLLLVNVKGLLVVSVAVAAKSPPPDNLAGAAPPWDEREVRELRALLDRFFDDEDDTNSGRIDRLSRLVEPVVSHHAIHSQQLIALKERLDRLERLGPE